MTTAASKASLWCVQRLILPCFLIRPRCLAIGRSLAQAFVWVYCHGLSRNRRPTTVEPCYVTKTTLIRSAESASPTHHGRSDGTTRSDGLHCQRSQRSQRPQGTSRSIQYTLIRTLLCSSYHSYQNNLVTLNNLELITRRDNHIAQSNST